MWFWSSLKEEDVKEIKFYVLYLMFLNVIFYFTPFNDYEGFFLSPAHPFEIWRYITSLFIHYGLGHLISNMFALLIFGTILEGIIGSRNFLIVYFLSGIAGGIFFNLLTPPDVVGAGASGAISGIIGALTVLRPKLVLYYYVPMPLILLSAFYLFQDLYGLFYPTDSIGYAAHIGGFLAGALWGLLNRHRFKEYYEVKKEVLLKDEDIDEWEKTYM
ncbi:MAG: rhomboid family intramembrane serine protease [Candidatus Nanohaloarchaeota archaeon]|nr:rhomboid family intramembrane serine protease [Candidatus Nanohaloarchaeota archaeon]